MSTRNNRRKSQRIKKKPNKQVEQKESSLSSSSLVTTNNCRGNLEKQQNYYQEFPSDFNGLINIMGLDGNIQQWTNFRQHLLLSVASLLFWKKDLYSSMIKNSKQNMVKNNVQTVAQNFYRLSGINNKSYLNSQDGIKKEFINKANTSIAEQSVKQRMKEFNSVQKLTPLLMTIEDFIGASNEKEFLKKITNYDLKKFNGTKMETQLKEKFNKKKSIQKAIDYFERQKIRLSHENLYTYISSSDEEEQTNTASTKRKNSNMSGRKSSTRQRKSKIFTDYIVNTEQLETSIDQNTLQDLKIPLQQFDILSKINQKRDQQLYPSIELLFTEMKTIYESVLFNIGTAPYFKRNVRLKELKSIQRSMLSKINKLIDFYKIQQQNLKITLDDHVNYFISHFLTSFDKLKDLIYSIRKNNLNLKYYTSILEAIVNLASYPNQFTSSNQKKYLNIIITGNPGVGKTYIANDISKMFKYSGFILQQNKMNVVSTDKFIGNYMGETPGLTLSTLHNSLENVIFIDEAYKLAVCQEPKFVNKKEICTKYSQYSKEAMDEINQFLGDYGCCIIMIAAGYEKGDSLNVRMKDTFLAINPGISRRFPIRINMKDVSASDTSTALITLLKDSNITFPSKKEEGLIRKNLTNKFSLILQSERLKNNYSSVSMLASMIAKFFVKQSLQNKISERDKYYCLSNDKLMKIIDIILYNDGQPSSRFSQIFEKK